jgi:hypothetical protein
MSAVYATGEEAICALVNARTLLEAVGALQQRMTELGLRLQEASSEADWRARQALKAIDDFARTDPLQLGARPTDECLDAIDRGSDRVRRLELDIADVLRRAERNGAS